MIQFRMTTKALKTIDKYGGVDNYLLNTPSKKLNSDIGEQVKVQLLEELKKRGETIPEGYKP